MQYKAGSKCVFGIKLAIKLCGTKKALFAHSATISNWFDLLKYILVLHKIRLENMTSSSPADEACGLTWLILIMSRLKCLRYHSSLKCRPVVGTNMHIHQKCRLDNLSTVSYFRPKRRAFTVVWVLTCVNSLFPLLFLFFNFNQPLW